MEQPENKQSIYSLKIVGINVGILAAYTLFSVFTNGGIIADAFFIVFHFIGCIIFAIAAKKWVWVLSAFIILIIGFSTCVNYMGSQL